MTRQEPAPTPIRDAACVILTDTRAGEPRLLLGKRRDTQVFLPNMWVFPGGRVDDEDRTLAASVAIDGLSPGSAARLPFLAAALRELHEEAGLTLDLASTPSATPEPDTTLRQACAALAPIARAITPPGKPRRFDTWFFLADGALAAQSKDPDGELLDLDWFTFAAARSLDLPHITRLVVEDVADRLRRGHEAAIGQIPFYFQSQNVFHRQMISNDVRPEPALTADRA